MKNFFIYTVLALILFNISYSQENMNTLWDKLTKEYGKMSSIQLKFNVSELPALNGSFKAKNDNRYKIFLNDRIIVSNGKTNWNYSIKDKKVVISEIEDNNASNLSDILFSFSNSFKPNKLAKEQTSNNSSYYALYLLPNTDTDKNIKSLILHIEPQSNNIKTIVLNYNNGVQTWNISDLIINKKIANSEFEFTTPKGVESIDLR